jgi:hypothetical protein
MQFVLDLVVRHSINHQKNQDYLEYALALPYGVNDKLKCHMFPLSRNVTLVMPHPGFFGLVYSLSP